MNTTYCTVSICKTLARELAMARIEEIEEWRRRKELECKIVKHNCVTQLQRSWLSPIFCRGYSDEQLIAWHASEMLLDDYWRLADDVKHGHQERMQDCLRIAQMSTLSAKPCLQLSDAGFRLLTEPIQ